MTRLTVFVRRPLGTPALVIEYVCHSVCNCIFVILGGESGDEPPIVVMGMPPPVSFSSVCKVVTFLCLSSVHH